MKKIMFEGVITGACDYGARADLLGEYSRRHGAVRGYGIIVGTTYMMFFETLPISPWRIVLNDGNKTILDQL